MPKCQRDRLLLKWAPKNIRVGIDSKAAAAKINLVERRSIIGGHEGSGLFRTGSKGEGVVLLQVKLDWNPDFKVLDNEKRKNIGKIYISNTPSRLSRAEKIGQSRTVLPAVEKNPSESKFWRFSGWWRIVSQTFDKDEIFKQVGLRSKKKRGKCFDVGCVQTWKWIGWVNPGSSQPGKIQGEKQEKIEGADDETTDDEEEEIISNNSLTNGVEEEIVRNNSQLFVFKI